VKPIRLEEGLNTPKARCDGPISEISEEITSGIAFATLDGVRIRQAPPHNQADSVLS